MLLGSVWFGWFVAVLPGEKLENDRLSHGLMDSSSSFFHRNLDLHEKLLVANDPDLETLAKLLEPELKQQERLTLLVKIKGLDLQNRDLRFANLSQSKLWKADLRGGKLQQANLGAAQLQGIQWGVKAQLQSANLREAKLQGADLGEAQLQCAHLGEAELQGADLVYAELQSAYLRYAKLQGADLSQAQLQGAHLGEAELQGADLVFAELQGANLENTQLQGAKLEFAYLQGANLEYTQVGSAKLSKASFAFNDFRDLQTLPLFTQQDFESLKANIRGLKHEYAATKWVAYLQSRIGQATEWPTEAIAAPCLADQPSAAPFQNCLASNPDYFNALANYLGDLACRANAELEGQDFIAKGIARRTIDSTKRGKEGESARRQLAQRLLKPDCAGQAGLTDDQRAELRQLAAAP